MSCLVLSLLTPIPSLSTSLPNKSIDQSANQPTSSKDVTTTTTIVSVDVATGYSHLLLRSCSARNGEFKPLLFQDPDRKRTYQLTILFSEKQQPVEGDGFVNTHVCHCADCRKVTATMFASNVSLLIFLFLFRRRRGRKTELQKIKKRPSHHPLSKCQRPNN